MNSGGEGNWQFISLASRLFSTTRPPLWSATVRSSLRRGRSALRAGRVTRAFQSMPFGTALSKEMRFPHSPGMLYSVFTYYTGFKVDWGEYKLMGEYL